MEKLAATLTEMGHPISADTVPQELVKLGFSRQSNRKADEDFEASRPKWSVREYQRECRRGAGSTITCHLVTSKRGKAIDYEAKTVLAGWATPHATIKRRRRTPPIASIVAALERQPAKGDKALVSNTGFRCYYLKTKDTTSLYFEGAGGQTLGRHGYSKDHRPDLRQMILAVLINGDGRPVCSEMWPGHTADVITLIPVIDRLRPARGSCRTRDRGWSHRACGRSGGSRAGAWRFGRFAPRSTTACSRAWARSC